MDAQLRQFFDAIQDNYGGRSMDKIAKLLKTMHLEPRVDIIESWEWAPGDKFGAREHPDRMLLGRIFVEDRPSAHFLCLSTDKRLDNYPIFLVTNSLEPDENLATFNLWSCLHNLPNEYKIPSESRIKGRAYISWKQGSFVRDRKQEMLDSCDRMAETILRRHNQGLPPRPGLLPLLPWPEFQKQDPETSNPTPSPKADDPSGDVTTSTPKKSRSKTDFTSKQFISRHIKPEFQRLLNEMPRRTAVEKEFVAEVTDALVFMSLMKM